MSLRTRRQGAAIVAKKR